MSAQYNIAYKLIKEKGYRVLNMMDYDYVDAMGLDFKNDYYDYYHTNIHGTIKYSIFLANILAENCGFEGKCGDLTYIK